MINNEKQKINSNNKDVLQHFTFVNGKYYDKYDFILNDFLYDKNKQPVSNLTIDVKTQFRTKFINKVTEDWQFAINSNTIKQNLKNTEKVDSFLFLFCKNEATDFIDEKACSSLLSPNINYSILMFKNNALNDKCTEQHIKDIIYNIDIIFKETDIDLDVGGMISPKRFIELSEEFKKGEIFRFNMIKNGDLLPQISKDNIYRITQKHLTNIDKCIPDRVINNKQLSPDFIRNKRNEYLKKLGHADINFVKTNINNFNLLIPFDKIYHNSQFKNFNDYIISTFRDKNQSIKNKNNIKNK